VGKCCLSYCISRIIVIVLSNREVLIEKHWRGNTSRTICDLFWDEVSKYPSKNEVPPIITTPKHYLFSIYRNDIFLLAITVRETSPLLVIEYLRRVYDILEDYFEAVEEGTIRDNFSTVYQLLEEMMDYGYPLTTEPNALKAMIAPPTVMTKLSSAAGLQTSTISDILPNGTVSNMPWRKTGVKYMQNEIYLDIVEEMDAIIDKYGTIITTEVNGSIQANSRLSGVPDLTLVFVEPDVIDDCSFHPCVRYNRFEKDKVVSFVPPDGAFELMKYRVRTAGPPLPPCYCQPQFNFESNNGTVTLTVGTKTMHSLKFVAGKSASSLMVSDFLFVTSQPLRFRFDYSSRFFFAFL
jgi:AP-3 complex subunit mu